MQVELIGWLLQLVGGLLGLLVIIIGWIGARIHKRLDEISIALTAIKIDLHAEIASHSERIAVIEARCQLNHPQ